LAPRNSALLGTTTMRAALRAVVRTAADMAAVSASAARRSLLLGTRGGRGTFTSFGGVIPTVGGRISAVCRPRAGDGGEIAGVGGAVSAVGGRLFVVGGRAFVGGRLSPVEGRLSPVEG